MEGKTPKWESELWSYVGSGDGAHCPIRNHCQVRQQGGWCADDNKERLSQVADAKRCHSASYDFIEGGTNYCRITQMVEMLAQKYLKEGGVHCPPVSTGLLSLADKQHTIETRLLPLKVYHGAIWHLREGWIIQLNDNDILATRRLTLFHEAFHILAHCKTAPVFRKRGSLQGSFNELLADHFAKSILMPREWVKEKWAEVKDLDKMAEIFGVPKSAMCISLKRLGIT